VRAEYGWRRIPIAALPANASQNATPQPGKKTHMEHHAPDVTNAPDEVAPEGEEKV